MSEAVLKQRKRFNFRGSLCIPYGVFMALFVIFPLLLILYYAFTDEKGRFSFGNWGTVFSSPENWKVIGATFLIAGATTIICILIAYPIAYLLSNKKYNKNKVLVYIFLLPIIIATYGYVAVKSAPINTLKKAFTKAFKPIVRITKLIHIGNKKI